MITFQEIFDQALDRVLGSDNNGQLFHLRLMAATYQCVLQDLGANRIETNHDYQIIRAGILLFEDPQTLGLPEVLGPGELIYLKDRGIDLGALEDAGIEFEEP